MACPATTNRLPDPPGEKSSDGNRGPGSASMGAAGPVFAAALSFVAAAARRARLSAAPLTRFPLSADSIVDTATTNEIQTRRKGVQCHPRVVKPTLPRRQLFEVRGMRLRCSKCRATWVIVADVLTSRLGSLSRPCSRGYMQCCNGLSE